MSECWPYNDIDLGKGKFLRKTDSIRKVMQNLVCYENSVWEIILWENMFYYFQLKIENWLFLYSSGLTTLSHNNYSYVLTKARSMIEMFW